MGERYADVQYYEVKGDGGSLALIKSEITALNSDEAAPRRRKKGMRTRLVGPMTGPAAAGHAIKRRGNGRTKSTGRQWGPLRARLKEGKTDGLVKYAAPRDRRKGNGLGQTGWRRSSSRHANEGRRNGRIKSDGRSDAARQLSLRSYKSLDFLMSVGVWWNIHSSSNWSPYCTYKMSELNIFAL